MYARLHWKHILLKAFAILHLSPGDTHVAAAYTAAASVLITTELTLASSSMQLCVGNQLTRQHAAPHSKAHLGVGSSY